MNCSREGCFQPFFHHIYVEQSLWEDPQAVKILTRFPQAQAVPIGHYKDLFNRSRQNYGLQKQSPALILARRDPASALIHPGAPVCQDFGNRHFYYTSCMMNCVYDCEYCYLQGMYPSGNIVAFLDLDLIFAEVDRLLLEHPVYLCVSFDTDLLALESLFGFCKQWCSFAADRPGLTIEIRTKSANFAALAQLRPSRQVILAWTLSPQEFIARYEHHTAPLTARLKSAKQAMDQGWQVRLCFDPLLFLPGWERLYSDLTDTAFSILDPKGILDASLGTFRVSSDYLKRMRKQRPDSVILAYPFEVENGVCDYGNEASRQMTDFMATKLGGYLPAEKLFIWKGGE